MFADESNSTGEIFFVNSTATNATNAAGYGHQPDMPLASIAGAIATYTLNVGDRILCMPGHVEPAIAAAGGLTIPAGVTVTSLGFGNNRAQLSFSTANTASILLSGAGAKLDNLIIDCTGFAAIAGPINVTASDCQVTRCKIILANGTNQAVCGILTAAGASGLVVGGADAMGNEMVGTNNAGVTAAIIIVGGDRLRISNNFIQGAFSSGVGGIQQITTTTTNCRVTDNFIQNVTAACTKAMVFTASSTGQIARNDMQILSGTAPITGAAMSWVGQNYYAATIATAGTLI